MRTFGGHQGQPSSQVIRSFVMMGQVRTTLHRGTQGQNCFGMARAVESWRPALLLHEGRGRMGPWPMSRIGGGPGGGQARVRGPVSALRTLTVAWL